MSDNDVTRAPLPRGGGEFGWAQMDGPSFHSADPFEVQVRETESGQFQVTIRPKGLVSGGIQLALPLSWWVVVFASVCKAAGVEPATPVFTPADAVELAARRAGSRSQSMSGYLSLRDEMKSVVANLQQREWIQGTEQRGEAVCAHGAVMTCQGLRPGDQWIIRAVMRAKGVTESWNDTNGRTKQEVYAHMSLIEVTDQDLADTFGPSWRLVVAVIRRSAVLTADEAKDMAAAGAAAGDAAWDAAGAAVVMDLVGQHGLTQEHVDTLMGPWVQVLGESWADEVTE